MAIARKRIIDLMVGALLAEQLKCRGGNTKFCHKRRSQCPKATASPTCCTIESGDPNCLYTCDECVSRSYILISELLVAAPVSAAARARQKRVAAARQKAFAASAARKKRR